MPHNNLFLGPTDPISKQHLNPFSRSSTAHGCHQQTDTHRSCYCTTIFSFCFTSPVFKSYSRGGSLAEWTQVQKGPGSNRIRDAVGNSLRQTVHTHCASVHQTAKLAAALLRAMGGNCRPGGNWKVMAAYSQVYDSRHLQADCQEQGSAPEPYTR